MAGHDCGSSHSSPSLDCIKSGPTDGVAMHRVHLTLIAATLLYCVLLFSGLNKYGRHDWDQFSFRYETPRVALLRDHQLPLWNPYVNGGNVLLAHPDSPFPSPWYLLVLALGAPLGLRIQVTLFMALGATGMAALLRRWRLPPSSCFVGGVILMMSSHFALHIAEGHLEWCVLGLMPWLMLCVLRFNVDRRFIVVAALLLSSIVTFGSVYIIAIFVPFLSIWVALESIRQRSGKLVAGWAVALALTLLLSAVKFLPLAEFVQAHPRSMPSLRLSPAALVHIFLDPRQVLLYQATRDVQSVEEMRNRGVSNDIRKSLPDDVSARIHTDLRKLGVNHQWHEYGGYITYLGLVLALWGIATSWRLHWPLYSAGTLAAITVLGPGSPIDLWALLQHLPLYNSLQAPSRFLAAVVFVLAVGSAHGLAWLTRRMDAAKRWVRDLVKYGAPAAIFIELATLGWTLFGDVFVVAPIPLAQHQQFATRYRQLSTHFPTMYSYMFPALRTNSGVLDGYENVQVKRGAVRTVDDSDYRGEAYLEHSQGRVSITEWTMSRVTVAFETARPDRIVLNQNYFRGWRATVFGSSGAGKQRMADKAWGLVSIAVSPNDREVEFYYLPNSFVRGAWISGIALIGCVTFLVKPRQQKNRVGS